MADPEELSEDSLFDEAVGDAPADAAAEPAGEAAEQAGQGRDEAGRFAGKPEDKPDTVVEGDQAARPAVDDNAAQVPSWRVREINEEKRQIVAERDALRAEREQWQRQQPQPKPVDAPKVEKPDPLLDPEGYAKSVRDEIRAEIRNERAEDSLQLAHRTYKAEFEEAYAAAQKQIDPALKARMQQSRNPGETLMEWHRENKVRAEIGGDLAAYKQRQREEALKDPEFRKAAMAAWAAEAQPQQSNGRPRVELPPSLNGASRSNAALRSAMNADVDDDALFDQTTA